VGVEGPSGICHVSAISNDKWQEPRGNIVTLDNERMETLEGHNF